MELQQIRTQLETAQRLINGDHIQQAIAGQYFESVRQAIRRKEINETDVVDLLPRGYQLIPH